MKNQLLGFVLIFSLIGCNSKSEDSEIIRNISTILKQGYSNPPKLIAFNNIENLIETLENSNEFSEFTPFRFIEVHNENDKKWVSHTSIIPIGTGSQHGTQNNIGYMIYGKEETFVNEVRLILNIKNSEEKENALSELYSWSTSILKDLNIDEPDFLNSKILNGKQYYYENDSNYIILIKRLFNEDNHSISSYSEIKLD